jgi:magnesium transporter
MFPTLISSLFGMNLINGMKANTWGFPVAIVISLFVSIGSWWILRVKNLL